MSQAAERLGFSIWTKNSPKSYIDGFADFARQQELPMTAIVDDVLPEVVFDRTSDETRQMTESYVDYMQKIGFDEVAIVSEIMPDRDFDLARIQEIGSRISITTFLAMLPEKKNVRLEELHLSETIDPCWQINVLESGMAVCGITRYITGKRSTAFFRLAKSVVPALDFQTID